MGLITRILGGPAATAALGDAAKGVAEVFTANATRQAELDHDTYKAALTEAGAEFAQSGNGWFGGFVNGLNRLPRPFLALGTLGLFVYAMADPVGFSVRMTGLNTVPEPLWWLLGAIVSFYFGAREAHYFRLGRVTGAVVKAAAAPVPAASGQPVAEDPNAALEAWRAGSNR